MKYTDTRDKKVSVDFRTAVLNGMNAETGGLCEGMPGRERAERILFRYCPTGPDPDHYIRFHSVPRHCPRAVPGDSHLFAAGFRRHHVRQLQATFPRLRHYKSGHALHLHDGYGADAPHSLCPLRQILSQQRHRLYDLQI